MINAEEARKLTDGQRKPFKQHIYSTIEKFAKSGLSETTIDLHRYSYSIDEINLLIKELTFKGFEVKRTDDTHMNTYLTISW